MTAPTLIDLACEGVASAPGTSTTIALSGTAFPGGFLTWADAGAVNGVIYRLRIADGNTNEIATGVYNMSGNEFTNRTTLIASINGTKQTTPINASSSAVISAVALAEDIVTPGNYAGSLPLGFINAFRNMGCDVDQRNTRGTALTVTASGAYVTDGDIVLPTGASVTAGQAASQAGMVSANSLKVMGATSCTGVTLRRRIESIEAARAGLASQNITFQAKIYNNTGASITPTLAVGHPSTADTYSTVGATALANELGATNLQACPNGATTLVSYTLAVGSSGVNGLEFNLNLGNNFSTTGKTAQVTDWDVRATPSVAAGLNSNPPPPELRPCATEFVNCQRYLPGFSGQGPWGSMFVQSDQLGPFGCGQAPEGSYLVIVQFPVQTRVPVTGMSASGANSSIGFGAASRSAFQSSAVSVGAGAWSSLVPWGGTGSTSWAVFTGAEL